MKVAKEKGGRSKNNKVDHKHVDLCDEIRYGTKKLGKHRCKKGTVSFRNIQDNAEDLASVVGYVEELGAVKTCQLRVVICIKQWLSQGAVEGVIDCSIEYSHGCISNICG